MFISCRSLKFFIYISKSHMHSFFLFTSLFIHKWFFTFERSKVTKIFCKAEVYPYTSALRRHPCRLTLIPVLDKLHISIKKIVLSFNPTRFFKSSRKTFPKWAGFKEAITSQPFPRHQYVPQSSNLYPHDQKPSQ